MDRQRLLQRLAALSPPAGLEVDAWQDFIAERQRLIDEMLNAKAVRGSRVTIEAIVSQSAAAIARLQAEQENLKRRLVELRSVRRKLQVRRTPVGGKRLNRRI